MIIYKITNLLNNKCYIGQTKNSLIVRFTQHCKEYEGCVYLNRAIKKYGKENFIVEVIKKCKNKDQLNIAEIKYIKKFNSLYPNGYNIRLGGGSGNLSEETKKKISESKTGKKLNLTDQQRQNRSDMRKGNKNPFFGKKHSKAAKDKIRNQKLGKKQNKECIEKRVLKNKKPIKCSNGKNYLSIKDAERELNLNGIRKVLSGKRKQISGLTFEYINKEKT